MGDNIKSAIEIAMEKAKGIGEATDEERLKWKYIPEGERLAAKYLSEDFDLGIELRRYEEKAIKYVAEGALDILVRNVDLPKNESAKKNTKRAMEGIKAIKSDKVGVENIHSKLRRVFNHYLEQGEQQRKQAYETLKAEFGAKVQQAAQQQFGSMVGIRIDVARMPQFHEEWRKLLAQLDSQYLRLIGDYKQELLNAA